MERSKGELRRDKILELLKLRGKLSVQDIVEATGSSEATARRDLDVLEKTGSIIRTIGGAMQATQEVPFAAKQSALLQEKERIAETAASLVREGDVICLTGGTTTYLIARALKQHRGITIVTNAVNIAAELADAEDVQVVVTGGVMRSKSYELIGPLAESVIGKLNISKMFLGVDGVSAEHGFTMHSELEARIAQLLIERSSEVYAVFDHSKLLRSALFTIIPLDRATGIITDRQPDAPFEQACRERNVAVYSGPGRNTT